MFLQFGLFFFSTCFNHCFFQVNSPSFSSFSNANSNNGSRIQGFGTPDSVTPPPMGQAPIPITTVTKSTATTTTGELLL